MKLKGKAKAAFLRRMAKGRKKASSSTTPRRKRKRKSTRTKQAKGHKHHMAKRKSTAKRKSRRRGGEFQKYIPDNDKLYGIGSAFIYGKVEAAAKSDAKHFLKSVPAMVPQIGRAGNVGALLWLAGIASKHHIVKAVASGVLTVAAYQNGTGAQFTKDSQDFKMSGPGRRRDELLVESYLRGR